MSLTETIAAMRELRAMGARRIRIGDVEAEFSAPSMPVEPREQESPDVAAERERREYDAILFHSVD